MTEYHIEKSLFDEKFREECVKMLDSARHDVYIIAGELGSLKFDDVRNATEDAARRGVKVHAYATGRTPKTFQNYCVSRGYELYIGKRGLDTHYLLVDDKNMVISINKDPDNITAVGTREADVKYGDHKKAKEIINVFSDLVSEPTTRKITEFDKMQDPFYKLLVS
ncbi:hypothetical protein [Nitrosarchaeum sp. AC2]|uniref:hypothetical protein n=1 Tax=Nitrosarchaeum sp. AC2 TaxID=2259673 RepID=UPI0015CA0E78|nr:hypothetical protein [Nitrosarchaeum sp. AC2]QLH11236.1 hypothetical protein DSQ20_07025 [Nitrosarchaeum sp. AC2]